MISAKEAANITTVHRLNAVYALDSVEKAIASAAANGNNFVILNQYLIPDEVISSLINNGYQLEVRDDNIMVSWDACSACLDNGRDEYYDRRWRYDK